MGNMPVMPPCTQLAKQALVRRLYTQFAQIAATSLKATLKSQRNLKATTKIPAPNKKTAPQVY